MQLGFYKDCDEAPLGQLFICSVFNIRFGLSFYNTILYAWKCSTVVLGFCMCVYFCDFYSGAIPVPTVTYTRQELFACNNAIVSGGKLLRPWLGSTQ